MEHTNQQLRAEKIMQFSILYGGIILLLLSILYCSTVYIPHLVRQQQQMNSQEMTSFIGESDKLDQQIKQLESVSQLDDRMLDPIFSIIIQLKKTYPDSVYQKTLQSYQAMVGQLDNVKYVDPDLKDLQKQQQQAFEKKVALENQIKTVKKPASGVVHAPPPPGPAPTHSTGTVAAQEWGPYIPKLLKGNGLFDGADPYVKVNLSLAADDNVVKLIVYFETSFNQYSANGIDSNIRQEEILYTAPSGKRIDQSSLPLKNGWVFAYRDKSTDEEETATTPDGYFTCRMKGNTNYKIGDPRGAQLKIQLNKPLPITVE